MGWRGTIALLLDNRGVGGSGGRLLTSRRHGQDAIDVVDALKFTKVDLLGYSLGGFIAQVIAQERPDLVRRIILAGTGPAGGEGISGVGAVLQDAITKAAAQNKHTKHLLFFRPSNQPRGRRRDPDRLNERKSPRRAVTNETIHAQVTAIAKWVRRPRLLAAIISPFWSLTATTTSWCRQSILRSWRANCRSRAQLCPATPGTAQFSKITMS